MSQYLIKKRTNTLNEYIYKGYLTIEFYNELVTHISLPHNEWGYYVKTLINRNYNECYLNVRLNWLLNYYDLDKYIFRFFNLNISMKKLLELDISTCRHILYLNCDSIIDAEIIVNLIFKFTKRYSCIKKIKKFIDNEYIKYSISYKQLRNYKGLKNPEYFILLENKVISYYDLKDIGIDELIVCNILNYIQENKIYKDNSKFNKFKYMNNSLFSQPIENYLF